jgi:predicted outer membrane repeat protein
MPQRLIALATSALLIGGLFVGAPAPVRAVSNTVYVADVASAGAGGSCSAPDYATGVLDDDEAIQDAIDAVDASPSLTTVYLCAGTYNITTTLLPTEDIILKGADATTTILSGGATWADGAWVSGGVRILYSEDDVTIDNLTFTRGTAPSEGSNGGGAIAVDGTVTVTSSIFTQNEGDYMGGAIYSYYNPLIVTDSIFTDNIAEYGGAINTWVTATVTASTFTENKAGGGGAVRGDNVVISSSSFVGNEASSIGGASNGGAIRAVASATVANSTFTSNASHRGGAIFSTGEVAITASTFTGNTATDNGGAIEAAAVTATNSTFTNNDATDNGGAIEADTTTATNSTFTNNEAGAGGAIYSDITATNSTFTNNAASFGGAILADNTATATNSTFTNNDASVGGAIATEGDVNVTNSTFTNNDAFLYGGAIYTGTGTIARSRFTQNTAGENGGAVALLLPENVDLQQLRGNTFSRNTAAAGGAITLGPCIVPTRSQAARVERANRFRGNRATEQRRTSNVERWEADICGD